MEALKCLRPTPKRAAQACVANHKRSDSDQPQKKKKKKKKKFYRQVKHQTVNKMSFSSQTKFHEYKKITSSLILWGKKLPPSSYIRALP